MFQHIFPAAGAKGGSAVRERSWAPNVSALTCRRDSVGSKDLKATVGANAILASPLCVTQQFIGDPSRAVASDQPSYRPDH